MTDPNLDQRIAQWEQMVREAPDGMAWFSLANAYKEAGRPADAIDAYRKAIGADPKLSRAYQLLGHLLIQSGSEDEATSILTDGYTIAAEQGDVMPQRAMGSLLKQIDHPVPEVAEAAPRVDPAQLGDDAVLDRRTGQPGQRLPDPPMRGPVGRFIYDHYSTDTWRQWVGQGTKVINELRLDFSNVEHQKVYEQQMMEWLGFTQSDVDQHAAAPEQQG